MRSWQSDFHVRNKENKHNMKKIIKYWNSRSLTIKITVIAILIAIVISVVL
jgi:hypothetical protein